MGAMAQRAGTRRPATADASSRPSTALMSPRCCVFAPADVRRRLGGPSVSAPCQGYPALRASSHAPVPGLGRMPLPPLPQTAGGHSLEAICVRGQGHTTSPRLLTGMLTGWEVPANGEWEHSSYCYTTHLNQHLCARNLAPLKLAPHSFTNARTFASLLPPSRPLLFRASRVPLDAKHMSGAELRSALCSHATYHAMHARRLFPSSPLPSCTLTRTHARTRMPACIQLQMRTSPASTPCTTHP